MAIRHRTAVLLVIAFALLFLSSCAKPPGELTQEEHMQQVLSEKFSGVEIGNVLHSNDTKRWWVEASSDEDFVQMRGVQNPRAISEIKFSQKEGFATSLVTVDNISLDAATIRLEKLENVAYIGRCDDFVNDECISGWERSDLPFVDYGDYVEFIVPHFTTYAGVAQSCLALDQGVDNGCTTSDLFTVDGNYCGDTLLETNSGSLALCNVSLTSDLINVDTIQDVNLTVAWKVTDNAFSCKLEYLDGSTWRVIFDDTGSSCSDTMTTYSYDITGNITNETEAEGLWVRFTYVKAGGGARPDLQFDLANVTITYNQTLGCGNTLVADATLTENITGSGTCLTIGADNIVVDGAGYTLKGDTTGTGIDNTGGYDNVTIKNFAGINNFTNGITFTNVENSTIENNTIQTGDDAIVLTTSNLNNMTSNDITTDTATSAHGISFVSGQSNRVLLNTINTSTSGSKGIYLDGADINLTLIANNTVTTTSTTSEGIYLISSVDNSIENNTINVRDDGIRVGNFAHRNNITRNQITTTTNSDARGIDFLDVTGNRALLNTINTSTTSAYGIRMSGASCIGTMVANNTIITTGSSAYGIYFSNAVENTAENNTITSLSDGIAISGANRNNVTRNNVTTMTNTDTHGVRIWSGQNNTIRLNMIDTTTSSSYGIFLDGSDVSLTVVANNTVTTGAINAWAFVLDGTTDNLLENNTITAADDAIYLTSSAQRNNITRNDITTTANAASGILFLSATDNRVLLNSINTSADSQSYGMYLFGADVNETTIANNTIITNSASSHGFLFRGALDNLVENNTVTTTGSSSDGIYIDTLPATNNTFRNNQLSTSPGSEDISWNTAGIENTILIDQVIGNYSFTGAGGKITVEDSSFGKISFIQAVNGAGTNFSRDIKIQYNNVTLNGSNTGLNKSANITFYGLSAFVVPEMQRDGAACPAGVCTNLTPLDAGTVIINVTGWSSYYIKDAPCGNTLTADYTFVNHDTSTGTCITIGAHDLVIDGAGYNITGDGTGFGIDNNGGWDNVTIKNFGGITDFDQGIDYNSVETGVIHNNTIFTGDDAIELFQANRVNITSNLIITDTTTGAHGVIVNSGIFNRMLYNVVNTTTSASYGIYLAGSDVNRTLVANNTLYNSASNDIAIYLNWAGDNSIENNTLITEDDGIVINNSGDRNNITRNTISTGDLNGYGIRLGGGQNTRILLNTITTVDTGAMGINLQNDKSNYSLIANNTIKTTLGGTSYGIYLQETSHTIVENNTINSSTAEPIRMANLPTKNNTIRNNILIAGAGLDEFRINVGNINGTKLIDQPIGKWGILGVGGTLIVENTSNGRIEFLFNVSGSGTSLSNDIKIESGNITVNSSGKPTLNVSANLTFYNQAASPKTMYKGSEVCPEAICTNLTALDLATVVINVTHWSSYSLQPDRSPLINSLTVSPNPALNASTITITANVTDVDGVETVIAELLYPNGTAWQNKTLTGANPYTNTATVLETPLGNYTIRLFANDTMGNVNNTQTTEFTPYIAYSKSSSVVVNGSLEDWAGIYSIPDETGDAGSASVGSVAFWRPNNWTLYDSPKKIVANSVSRPVDLQYNDTTTYLDMAAGSGSSSFVNYSIPTSYGTKEGTLFTTGETLLDFQTGVMIYALNWTSGSLEIVRAITSLGASSFEDPLHEDFFNETGGVWIQIGNGDNAGGYLYDLHVTTPGKTYDFEGVTNPASQTNASSGGLEGTFPSCSNGYCDDTEFANGNNSLTTEYRDVWRLENGDINSTYTSYTGATFSTAWENYHFQIDEEESEVRSMVFEWRGDYSGSGSTDDFNISIWNGTNWILFSERALSHDNVTFVFEINESVGRYIDSNKRVHFVASMMTTVGALPQATIETDYVALHLNISPSGGTDFDITNTSVSNNNTHLLGRLGVDGSIDSTLATTFYRMYLGNGTSGNKTTMEGNSMGFNFSNYAQINGSTCKVYDKNHDPVGDCDYANDSDEIELAIPYSLIGASSGNLMNITWETAGASRFDLGPDADSFVLYTLNSGAADSCTPPTINTDWNVTAADNCTKTTQEINLGTGILRVEGDGYIKFIATNISVGNIVVDGQGGIAKIILTQSSRLIKHQ